MQTSDNHQPYDRAPAILRRIFAVLLIVVLLCGRGQAADSVLWWNGTNTVPGTNGGKGTWTTGATSNWCYWDDIGSTWVATSWSNGFDAIFPATTGGVVSLSGRGLTVSNLQFDATNYTLSPGSAGLDIYGVVTGCTFRINTGSRPLTFHADTRVDATLVNVGKYTNLVADGCDVVFDGVFDSSDGNAFSYNVAKNGGRLYFGPNARVNNNMPDLINARQIRFSGAGTNDVLEFDPDFQADHTEYPTNWHADGMSIIAVDNMTMITHASQSLPSISKKDVYSNYTHHGTITFSDGWGRYTQWVEAMWIVRSQDQEYDGGVNWQRDWTLCTESNLTMVNQYNEAAKVSFGNRGASGAGVTKKGSGALNLCGTQGYSTGSVMFVDEGVVNFYTDPGDPGPLYTNLNWPGINPGQYLELFVASNGTARFYAMTNGLLSLDSEGTVLVTTGALDVTGAVQLDSVSRLQLWVGETNRNVAPIRAHGGANLAGDLQLTWMDTPGVGDYLLLQCDGAQGVTNTFATADLPAWSRLLARDVDGSQLILRVYDPTLDDDGDGMTNAWELTNGTDPDTDDDEADPDGDGAENGNECVAGTSPTNRLSCLRITEVLREEETRIGFETVTNRLYKVESATNLTGTVEWTSITNGVEGTDGMVRIVVPTTDTVTFYRVKVRRPD